MEAAGVEPASLKPSAQIYYKLSRSNAIRVCDRLLHVRFGLSFFKQLETQPDSTSVLLAVDALAPSRAARVGRVAHAATAASSVQPNLARIASASAREGAISTSFLAVETEIGD